MTEYLLLGAVGLSLQHCALQSLDALRRVGASSATSVLGAVVTAVGLLTLVPTGGVMAAAWVSVAAYWLTAVSAIAILVRVLGLGWRELRPRPADVRYLVRFAIGSCTRVRICQRVEPIAVAASTLLSGTSRMPCAAIRMIGGSA